MTVALNANTLAAVYSLVWQARRAFDMTTGAPPMGTSREFPVEVYQNNETALAQQTDHLVTEVPVAMVYNGISHAVMMATPADLEDFALGFSLSEAILVRPEQLYDIDIAYGEEGVTLSMTIPAEQFSALKARRRALTGRTGCGLCGAESLAEAIRPIATVAAPTLNDRVILQALAALQHNQPLQQLTGASHAAAWCDSSGAIALAREDVGRHNALDKLIGALKKRALPLHDGFALISSRASYEMVHKTCAVGIGALVAVSAPTSLAVQQAQSAGQLLIGFARSGRHVIYHAG